MSSVASSSDLSSAVQNAALGLLRFRDDFADPHVHFDAPELRSLVPEFRDPTWLRLAPTIADIVMGVPRSFLVQVPIAEQTEPPDTLDLGRYNDLNSWQPPSIHLLRVGSAFAIRDRKPDAGYADLAPSAAGAPGWVGAWRDEAVWRVSLYYETPEWPDLQVTEA